MAFDFDDYFMGALPNVKRSAGSEVVSDCPFCGKAERLYVNTASGNFICFKCEVKGRRGYALVAVLEDMTETEARSFVLREATETRRKVSEVSLADRVRGMRDLDRVDPSAIVKAELPESFTPTWDGKRHRFPSYLKQRGFKKSTAQHFNMGFTKRGKYGGRIVIPIVCPNGEGWTARATEGWQQPKYMNPSGMDKSRLLMGWPDIASGCDFAVVEGPLDVAKFKQHGVPTVGLLGKVLHPKQLALLCTLPADAAVTVCLDPEETIAPHELAAQLLVHFEHVSLGRLPLVHGDDAPGVKAGDKCDPGNSTKAQALDAVERAERFKGARVERLSRGVEGICG